MCITMICTLATLTALWGAENEVHKIYRTCHYIPILKTSGRIVNYRAAGACTVCSARLPNESAQDLRPD